MLRRVAALGIALTALACGADPPSRECGGSTGRTCATGLTCVDNPFDSCDSDAGAGCSGICVDVMAAPQCRGIAGLVCASGQRCVDDPNDGCDPHHAADCIGVCVSP